MRRVPGFKNLVRELGLVDVRVEADAYPRTVDSTARGHGSCECRRYLRRVVDHESAEPAARNSFVLGRHASSRSIRISCDALQAVALMHQGQVVDLTATNALEAARLSLELKLPIADSIMLATARAHAGVLWTQDEDFDGLDGVRYVKAVTRPPP